jgi:hypothetical protein
MSAQSKKPGGNLRKRTLPAPLPSQKEDVEKRARKRHIADNHIENMMSMMDPGAFASGSTSIPARGAWLRSVTTESIVQKLSQADGSVTGSGQFSVEARARPDGALIIRSNAANDETDDAVTFPLSTESASTADTQFVGHEAAAFQGRLGYVSASSQQGTTAAGGTAWVIALTSAGGGATNIVISRASLDCVLFATPFTGPIGAMVAGAVMTLPVTKGGGNAGTLTLPANCQFVGFTYGRVASGDAGKKLVISAVMNASAVLRSLAATSRFINLNTLTGIDQLRAYRVAGQSVLLTYTGSQLNNGGEIAIARVSAAWAPQPGQTVYEAILKLPKSRRYSGPVRNGAHCFWVPETVEDFEPKLYGADYGAYDKPTFKIVAAGALDDPTESIMLQLETIVEFSTDAPSYASVDYAPPWDSFDKALLLVASINPCGENSKHIVKIKKFLERKVREAYKYALENPAEAMAMIGQAAAMIA